jgi:APA family basic amino acid/polyamine antiporter
MLAQLVRKKSVADATADDESPHGRLKRTLGVVDLTALGIGAIIGAGIFSSTGTAAAGGGEHIGAGPALIVSYVLTAVACGFAALCYAELASMIPIAGSAYTYAYVTLGEFLAWIIGWDLILEYGVGNVAVAVSWSSYFQSFLAGFNVHFPSWMVSTINQARANPEVLANAPHLFGLPIVFNLPALAIVALLTVLLVIGVKESARVNSIIVVVKIALVIAFISVGAFWVVPANWHPFAPNGFKGIMTGASIIFFAYIGFDAISTTAEEAKNPQRDLPLAMIASLIICTILYIAVTVVLTGMVPTKDLGVADPLALALQRTGMTKLAGIFSFGTVIAMTAVLLVFQLGQPRIFMSMARDGLLPAWAAKIHPRYQTPHVTTILTGVLVAVPALLFDINEMVEFTNIGTLAAFVLVSAGVIVLRYTEPDRPRPFRCPLVPVVPLLSIGCCIALMIPLPRITWFRFVGWMIIGLFIYFIYGMRRSRLATVKEG